MSRFAVRTTLCLCLAALVCVPAATAGDEHKHDAAAMPGMDPAAMEAMTKAATPGEHHAHMATQVGVWRANTKMWMMPGADPVESTATMTVKPMLGGRFFRSTFEGIFMGQPFEGISIDGYDNILGKHTGVWMDSMGTMMMVFEGDCAEDGRIVKMMAEFTDPMTRGPGAMKTKATQTDENTITWEAWSKMPNGEWYRSMEMVYTRQ